MWMTTGVWVTIVGAIITAMRFLNGFVTKTACHTHGAETLKKIDDLSEKVGETNSKVDTLTGFVHAKFDGTPHEHHRVDDN
jgi:outer membrane murein-binding lipoprotein Lpp